MKSKRSYIYLFIGLAFLLFTGGKFNHFLLAWFPNVFLIRFFRKGKTISRYIMTSLSVAAISIISWYGIQPLPLPAYIISMSITSFITTLPLLLDRILYRKVPLFASTLIFPITSTLLEYIFISGNPMGSFGALAYTQSANLPLIQLASLTGLMGITFLMSWFPVCINHLWEREWKMEKAKGIVITLSAILISSHLFGAVNLLIPSSEITNKVSVIFKTDEGLELPQIMSEINKGDFNSAERAYQSYMKQTQEEMERGQEIIAWPEGAVITNRSDLEVKLQSISGLADRGNMIIAAPFVIFSPEGPVENSLYLFGKEGEVLLHHIKFGGNIYEGSVPGDGVIDWAKEGASRYSAVICWDMDFPGIMSQTGRNGVDILIAPANDWKEINPIHGEMALFRAIENGTSLVRPATSGLSIISDYKGRISSKANWFRSGDTVIRGEVPQKGTETIYSKTGDVFPMILAVGFLILLIQLLYKGIRKSLLKRKTAEIL